MLRTSTLSVSLIALLTAAACAQEDPATTAGAETAAEVQILDAAQVTTRDDAKLFAKSEFAQADLNSDGSIDEGEFVAYASVRTSAAPAAVSGEQPAGEQTAPAPTETATAATAEQQFAQISNGDETISETELAEVRAEQFDAADSNGDDTLDSQERLQFASLTAPKASGTPL
jgi:hypothetical protein